VIWDFVDKGILPAKSPERFWINDYLLIRKGYSKSDLQNMDIDEYDFISELMFELNKAKKDTNIFSGGI